MTSAVIRGTPKAGLYLYSHVCTTTTPKMGRIPTLSRTKPAPKDLPIRAFLSAQDLESFLDREHITAPGFYLKLAKKSSGIVSVTASEAVETALCFGWIDGRANSIDESWYTVRYTPRRQKSIWSQKNVQTVTRLIEAGRMRPAGIAAVNAAKADGRWERAYAGPATIEVPEDFRTALASEATAMTFFEGLNRSDRYSVLWRIETASPASRARRIRAMLEMLAVGTVPGTDSKLASKSKQRSQAKEKVKKPSSSNGRPEKKSNLTHASNTRRQPKREGLRRRL